MVDASLSGGPHHCRWGSLLLAPLALVTAKGGKAHRPWGKIYFWCMTVVAFTALVMAVYRPILFLALVAIFSFYAAFVGLSRARAESRMEGSSLSSTDWTGQPPSSASSPALTLALLGAFRPELVSHLRIPAIVFGADRHAHCCRGHVALHPSAKREDVLVVRAPAGHDRQLHRGLDRLLRRHPSDLCCMEPGGYGLRRSRSACPQSSLPRPTTSGSLLRGLKLCQRNASTIEPDLGHVCFIARVPTESGGSSTATTRSLICT